MERKAGPGLSDSGALCPVDGCCLQPVISQHPAHCSASRELTKRKHWGPESRVFPFLENTKNLRDTCSRTLSTSYWLTTEDEWEMPMWPRIVDSGTQGTPGN